MHSKLDGAERSRNQASAESLARHDSIIDACQGSGHSNPYDEEEEEPENGGNIVTHHQRSIASQNNIVTSTPCPKIDFNSFRKYLRIYPA